MYDKLIASAKFIKSQTKKNPMIGIVLGSGLGVFVDQIENKTIIPYSEIPYFKKTTVEGHEGRLIIGSVGGIDVVALQGRFHAYEGLPMDEVVFPIRVLALLGIRILVLTNAAGSVNLNFKPGDLVLINDHINLMGKNPLVGPNLSELGPRFPDMSEAYHKNLIHIMKEVSLSLGKEVQEGVYAGMLGPTYETPAEIRMVRALGGDMVGMSTVPECIAANHFGIKVCGISCITNFGAGITNQKLSHDEVKVEAQKAMNHFTLLLQKSIIKFGDIL